MLAATYFTSPGWRTMRRLLGATRKTLRSGLVGSTWPEMRKTKAEMKTKLHRSRAQLQHALHLGFRWDGMGLDRGLGWVDLAGAHASHSPFRFLWICETFYNFFTWKWCVYASAAGGAVYYGNLENKLKPETPPNRATN